MDDFRKTVASALLITCFLHIGSCDRNDELRKEIREKKSGFFVVPREQDRIALVTDILADMQPTITAGKQAIVVTPPGRPSHSYQTEISSAVTSLPVQPYSTVRNIPRGQALHGNVLIMSMESLTLSLRASDSIPLRDASLIVFDNAKDLMNLDRTNEVKNKLRAERPGRIIGFLRDTNAMADLESLRQQLFPQNTDNRPAESLTHPAVDHAVRDLRNEIAPKVDLHSSLGLTYPDDFVKDKLGNYKFKDNNLLLKALLHQNYKEKQRKGDKESYEPLDFIGTFVLDYIVSKEILLNSKNKTKHFMMQAKSVVLRQETCSLIAVKNDFHKFVFVDGEQDNRTMYEFVNTARNVQSASDLKGKRRKRSFLYKFFKSVAGAIYVDSGYDDDKVSDIYMPMLKPELDQTLQ